MAYKLQLKRGASGSLPTGSAGEPLFTTDTNDLYIGTGAANQRFQKYIASGTSSQFLKGDGSLDSGTYQAQLNGTGFVKISGTTISYDNTSYLPLTGGTLSSASSSETLRLVNTGTGYGLYNQSDSYFQGDVKFQSVSNTILKVDASNKLIAAVAGTDYQAPITNPVTGTGTTNYLPKWTSGSAIGNSLVYDNGTYVGINTTTPGYALQVDGAATSGFVTSIVAKNPSTNAASATKIGFDNGGTIWGEIGASYNSNNPYMAFFVRANSEKMRITDGGNLIVNSTTDNGNRLQITGNGYFSGSVGVGTSSPAALLHVNSTGTHTFVYSTISGSSAIALDNQGGDLRIFTGGAERMRLTSSGNLGLGVTPSAWGSVLKAIQVGAGGAIWNFTGSNNVVVSSNVYDDGAGNQRYINTGTAGLYAMNGNSHAWSTAPSGTAGNAITFTQAMTLTANGRLLLGTTTEGTYLLDVNGVGRFSGRLDVTGTTNYSALKTTNTSGNIYWGVDNSTGSDFTGVAYARFIYSEGAYPLITFVNGAERMRLTSAGRLLLGTTTESTYLLDVNGTARVSGDVTNSNGANIGLVISTRISSNSGGILQYYTTENTRYTGFVMYNSANALAASLQYADSSVAETALRDSLILGTRTVSGKTLFISGVAGNVLMTLTAAGRLLIGNIAESTYILDANGTGRFRDNTGLVLMIGNTTATATTTPATISLGASYGTNTAGNSGNLKLKIYDDGTTSSPFGFGVSNSLFEFQANGDFGFFTGATSSRTQMFRVKATGAVRYIPIATPSSAESGDVYYDSTSNKLRCYNGTSWNDLF